MSRRLTAFLGTGLVAAAGCTSAGPGEAAPEGVAATPNLSVMYSNPAVDHVVTYTSYRGYGPRGGRVTLWRRGPRVREEEELVGPKDPVDPSRSTSWSNIATLASISGNVDPGGNGGFTVWNRDKVHGRYRLVRTAETKTIAGERCTVWHAEPLGDSGVRRRGCIADDGVVLYDSWLYSSSEAGGERTAVRVQRRKVAPTEVLPPKAAMRWSSWLAGMSGTGPQPTGKPLNYDLRLKADGGSEGSSEELRYRASGGWESTEERRGGKLQSYRLSHSSGRLSLSTDEGQLQISSRSGTKPVPTASGTAPLDRPAQRVLGEECRWFDTSVGIQDYSRHECRSADGLPLAVTEGGRGIGRSYVAVSVSRGRTPPAAVLPPAGLLGWAKWGWPELER